MIIQKIKDFITWFFKPFREPFPEPDKFALASMDMIDVLYDYGIEVEWPLIKKEGEWTDFCFSINDPKQMARINTWLQNDIKKGIKGYYNIQISAPNPVAGKEAELRIRVYDLVG